MKISLLLKCNFNIIVYMNGFAEACMSSHRGVKSCTCNHNLELTSAVDWNFPYQY